MIIDKRRHMDVMLLVRYMMEHHDFVGLDDLILRNRIFTVAKLTRYLSGSNSLMVTRIYSDSPS